MNKYDRLEAERSTAGSEPLTAVRELSQNLDSPEMCVLFSRLWYNAATCRQYGIIEREPNENRRQGDGNGSGNGRPGGRGGGIIGNGNRGRRSPDANKAGRSCMESDEVNKKAICWGYCLREGPTGPRST